VLKYLPLRFWAFWDRWYAASRSDDTECADRRGGGRVWDSGKRRSTLLAIGLSGCLLVVLPAASAGAAAPVNAAPPVLSGAARVNDQLTTTAGIWTNSPTTITYAWERCNGQGKSCKVVAGATSATLPVASTFLGGKLRAIVTATNSTRSVVARSGLSEIVIAAPTGVVDECGTISGSQTWNPTQVHRLTCPIVLKGTLTVQPGTIIKMSGSMTITLQAKGNLIAAGKVTLPVDMTSIRDDAIGGDTNGDGAATQPAAGDFGTAVNAGTDSTTTLQGARVRYAQYGLRGSDCTSVNVSDTIFGPASPVELRYGCLTRSVVRGNLFNGSGMALQSGDASGINFSSATNTFTGTPAQRAVVLDRVTVDRGKSWAIGSSGGAVFVRLASNVPAIAVYGTLTVSPSAIIKVDDANGIDVTSTGTLNLQGTITSYHDDTIGGDTNANANATQPSANDYATGVVLNGGKATLQGARVRYAQYGVRAWSDCKGTNITNSTFGPASPVELRYGCLTRSVVRGNQFNSSGMTLHAGEASGVSFAGANTNTFTGAASQRVVNLDYVTVDTGKTWTLSSAGGTTFVRTQRASLPAVRVLGHLSVLGDTIIKADGGGAIDVAPFATLDMHGRVTSYRDDTIGGDTNGDATETQPAPGDYGVAINMATAASVSVDGAWLSYATKAIDVPYGTPATVSSSTFSYNESAVTKSGAWVNTPCPGFYTDYVVAVGNTWLPEGRPTISPEQASLFATALFTSPPGWLASVAVGTHNRISASMTSCNLPTDPPSTYSVAATPILIF